MASRSPLWGLLVLCLGALLVVCTDASPTTSQSLGPVPALKAIAPSGSLELSPEDRCPVCAMAVAEGPKTAAGLELKDGRTYYFCGNGCLMKTWVHPEHFLGAGPEVLKRPIVQEYFSGKPLDARQALFVAGSDVMGRMGPAMVALEDTPEAKETFMARHGGKATFHLSELNDARWQELTGKPMVKAAPSH